METWKKFLIITAITLTIGLVYVAYVLHERKNPGAAQLAPGQKLTMDDVAVVRMEFPQHFADVQDLIGKSVWMKNGYTMPYFPYAGGKVEWKKPAGLIPPAQKLDVKKVIKAAAPADVDDSVSHGGRQVLVVFTLADGKDQFATPVGAIDSGQEQYFDDILFFYDDPHSIYTNWPKDIWAAVDSHQVKQGMNELQTRMAIGQKAQYDGDTEGDRTVTYDQDGKKWVVTFVNNRAKVIKQG